MQDPSATPSSDTAILRAIRTELIETKNELAETRVEVQKLRKGLTNSVATGLVIGSVFLAVVYFVIYVFISAISR
jgi:uncharacterized membrane protein YukC